VQGIASLGLAVTVVDATVVRRLMGHRHITTTEHYLRHAPNPEAAAKLSGLRRGNERPTKVVKVLHAA
jgi:hypothetical protein